MDCAFRYKENGPVSMCCSLPAGFLDLLLDASPKFKEVYESVQKKLNERGNNAQLDFGMEIRKDKEVRRDEIQCEYIKLSNSYVVALPESYVGNPRSNGAVIQIVPSLPL
ncbi:hypothetical protein [Anaerovibrio sp.]|uniref:hypothetical protein n=1 Tax=Anaerovibrio sp. TaxID=1872532 RepID=UPI00388D11E2